ncbi:MAG TPA: ABC transporter ATP-binding protein [Ktedonobacterales bacterium]|jgi:ABC-2 type transport system ATP-binding protein|nr:ABC transporter ATP-binding protein [Ktedonobacterales bacterium]
MPEEYEQAIEVEHLVKRFPRTQRNAVDGVSFGVRSGETFGLLGPNGAGKTTTIGILTTRVLPTGGRATIGGVDVVANPIGAKQRIAVVPQRNNLDRTLRVGEILTYHAAYHGVAREERTARANTLLDEFGLGERRKQKLGLLSGGLEQRVMLARALMHEPEALFLDEPTNNLDPQSRLFLWDRIRALNARGLTILITTHDMEEADRLCGRIAIMDQGRILALDTPDGLRRLIPGGTMLELRIRAPQAVVAGRASDDGMTNDSNARFRDALARLPGVSQVERLAGPTREDGQPETLIYRLYASEDAGALLAGAAQTVIQAHGDLLDLRYARPSLEDVFIHLTGRNLRS